jgi:hypothetical protein
MVLPAGMMFRLQRDSDGEQKGSGEGGKGSAWIVPLMMFLQPNIGPGCRLSILCWSYPQEVLSVNLIEETKFSRVDVGNKSPHQ